MPSDIYLRTFKESLYAQPIFSDLESCYAQGEATGDQGMPRETNPYTPGTSQYAWYDSGWCQAQDEISGRL